jgi:hypothetical protein
MMSPVPRRNTSPDDRRARETAGDDAAGDDAAGDDAERRPDRPAPAPAPTPAADVVALQRTHGNASVTRALLQRAPATSPAPATTSE